MKIYNPTGFSSSLTGSFSGSVKGTFEGSFSGGTLNSISGAFTQDSSSFASRIDDLETFEANIDNTYATDAQLATAVSGLNADSSSYLKNTTDTLTGDLTVTGTLTAQEFHTEFVSGSIIYESGSTQFGNSSDDTHVFRGQLFISASDAEDIITSKNYSATGAPEQFQIRHSGGNDVIESIRGGLSIEANGVVSLQNDGGNVGIGTNTAGSKLEVRDVQNAESLIKLYNNRQDSSNSPIFGIEASNGTPVVKLSFYRGGESASGFMTFLTKASNAASLTEKMRLTNTGLLQLSSGGGGIRVLSDSTSPSNLIEYYYSGAYHHGLEVEGDRGLRIYSSTGDSSAKINFYTEGSERMRIDSSGNVKISGIRLNPSGAGGELLFGSDVATYAGIKTTSPAAQDIDLTFHTTTNAGVDGAPERMRIRSGGTVEVINSTSPKLRLTRGAKQYTSRVDNNNKFVIQEEGGNEFFVVESGASAQSIRIDNTGNVGIGTTSPYGKLHIHHTPSTTYNDTSFNSEPHLTLNGNDGTNYYRGIRLTNNSGNREAFFGVVQTSDSSPFVFQVYGTTDGYKERLRIGGRSGYASMYARHYPQTSTSSTTSIVDTGIVPEDGIYEIFIKGNANGGGSGLYKTVVHGYIYVAVDFTYPNVVTQIVYNQIGQEGGGSGNNTFTVEAKILYNSVEYSEVNYSIIASSQIRIKITGYNSSYVGQNQNVRILKRI